jgi:hypothetical protein
MSADCPHFNVTVTATTRMRLAAREPSERASPEHVIQTGTCRICDEGVRRFQWDGIWTPWELDPDAFPPAA